MDLLNMTLIDCHFWTNGLASFKFKLPENEYQYQSGQYATLKISREGLSGKGIKIDEENVGSVKRAYSIASAPHEDFLELYIAWVKSGGKRTDGQGVLTTELFEAPKDLKYEIAKKSRGHFFPCPDRKIIMVATGTGLAPFISIMRTWKNNDSQQKCILIYGVSHREDLAYTDELIKYVEMGMLEIRYAVSRESHEDIRGHYCSEYFINRNPQNKGRINVDEIEQAIIEGRHKQTKLEKLLGKDLNPNDHQLMLCGNPAMINNIQLLASHLDFDPKKDVVVEQYW